MTILQVIFMIIYLVISDNHINCDGDENLSSGTYPKGTT
jgi:hypothetical protein